jgi:hypothetical protein
MKSFLLVLALAACLPSLAQATNICDPEAVDCATAHVNFMCGGHVTDSVQTAPHQYDVTVSMGCGAGVVYVKVKFDGLACTCTSVVSPGDGG